MGSCRGNLIQYKTKSYPMLKCNQCNEIKKADSFYKGQGRKCKECIKLNARKYKKENKDRKKIADAKYYEENKEIFIASNKRCFAKNPNYKKEYRKKNREYYNKYMTVYQKSKKHKESAYYSRRVLIKTRRLVTPETIEVKRVLMKINRLIKAKS